MKKRLLDGYLTREAEEMNSRNKSRTTGTKGHLLLWLRCQHSWMTDTLQAPELLVGPEWQQALMQLGGCSFLSLFPPSCYLIPSHVNVSL